MPYLTQSQKKIEVGPPPVGYQKSHNYHPKVIGEGIRAVGAVVHFLEV